MRRLLLLAGLLSLFGCVEDPETEPLRAGTSAVTVAWRLSASKVTRSAIFLDEESGPGSLPPGSRVTVLAEVGPKRRQLSATPQVRVRVEEGPLKGHIGLIYRPHLRRGRPVPTPAPPKPSE